MDVTILKCDEPNGLDRMYPLKEIKKLVKEFNKKNKDDSVRNVYYYRVRSEDDPGCYLGKIKKLKVKDKILYGEFEFSEDSSAQGCKKMYDECISKGVDKSYFDYRIMMDMMGTVIPGGLETTTCKDLEVQQFSFGLDSVWR